MVAVRYSLIYKQFKKVFDLEPEGVAQFLRYQGFEPRKFQTAPFHGKIFNASKCAPHQEISVNSLSLDRGTSIARSTQLNPFSSER
jgi:hypothetical protein